MLLKDVLEFLSSRILDVLEDFGDCAFLKCSSTKPFLKSLWKLLIIRICGLSRTNGMPRIRKFWNMIPSTSIEKVCFVQLYILLILKGSCTKPLQVVMEVTDHSDMRLSRVKIQRIKKSSGI
ncbi:hypothetical protein AVEN_205583-1 [Araneus ventricosus]|uniref:Uncharacterized protein n=1 Tax=Araneus ventricosus TaxID=182803 RepID=A0A4Y2F6A8_ARAVE|nr:hypothetical protein AVEN_205583-1 [Araneus ventricosus]